MSRRPSCGPCQLLGSTGVDAPLPGAVRGIDARKSRGSSWGLDRAELREVLPATLPGVLNGDMCNAHVTHMRPERREALPAIGYAARHAGWHSAGG